MPQRVTLDGINPHALHELKETFTPEQTPAPQGETPNKQEQKLFILFPAFEKHSKELKEKGFYEQKGDFLEWKHGKSPTLAFYFGTLQKKTKRVGNIGFMWADIESAFNVRNLAQYWKTNQDGEYAYNHKKKNVSAYENKLLDIIKKHSENIAKT